MTAAAEEFSTRTSSEKLNQNINVTNNQIDDKALGDVRIKI